ncbi:uncharacterized protein L969DRAFT_91054 [Mixia osmundae IAM 14324]|uniref:MIT domain-containing protein n=1 Tax=Mixia osmundae (strain CBS 9802 / IAM 14324 / JCM 22182 / KY 12970) TaxID=764103 RepID=G7DUJ6_MIXOS|nr:uncharacterized protein L969DRAFT_91054 [Mixia osmundae IAM 14324]KEI36409.1 hypothetical protein L969DRAFT_91054 [Mixia osmundae IAM 14324]GAA94256.1 hypothetical protein E5Q_00905 [Mixia osmundae IAM 14324]
MSLHRHREPRTAIVDKPSLPSASRTLLNQNRDHRLTLDGEPLEQGKPFRPDSGAVSFPAQSPAFPPPSLDGLAPLPAPIKEAGRHKRHASAASSFHLPTARASALAHRISLESVDTAKTAAHGREEGAMIATRSSLPPKSARRPSAPQIDGPAEASTSASSPRLATGDYTSRPTSSSAVSPSQGSSKVLLTTALQTAQKAVEYDGDNRVHEALQAYKTSVDLLQEVMTRVEETALTRRAKAIEREDRLAQTALANPESEEARQDRVRAAEKAEKREKDRLEEGRRLKVIHDTYTERIKMLQIIVDTQTAELVPVKSQSTQSSRDSVDPTDTSAIGQAMLMPASPQRSLQPIKANEVMPPIAAGSSLRSSVTVDAPRYGHAHKRSSGLSGRFKRRSKDSSHRESQLLGGAESSVPMSPEASQTPSMASVGEAQDAVMMRTESTVTYTSVTAVQGTDDERGPATTVRTASYPRRKPPPLGPLPRPGSVAGSRALSPHPSEASSLSRKSSISARESITEEQRRELLLGQQELHQANTGSSTAMGRTRSFSQPIKKAVPPPVGPPPSAPLPAPKVYPGLSMEGVDSRRAPYDSLTHGNVPETPTSDPFPSDLGATIIEQRSAAGQVADLLTLPSSPLRRPLHILRLLEMSITDGGFVTPRLFIPPQIWAQSRIKLTATETKLRILEAVSQGLEILEKEGRDMLKPSSNRTPYQAAKGFAKELESFGDLLDELQGDSAKKLGFTDTSRKKSFGASWSSKLSKSIAGMTSSKGLESPGAYTSSLARCFAQAQSLDPHCQCLESPEKTRYAEVPADLRKQIDARLRRSSDFFASIVIPFVMQDLALMLDKYAKRAASWCAD